jgi:hypothetical protein
VSGRRFGVVGLCGRQRLARNEFALEGRVFDEVPDEEVPAPAGYPRPGHVFGDEFIGKSVEQSSTGVEVLEHLPMPGGIRTAAFDDVRAVFAMTARRVNELSVSSERDLERIPEVDGHTPVQDECLTVNRHFERLPVGRDRKRPYSTGVSVGRRI